MNDLIIKRIDELREEFLSEVKKSVSIASVFTEDDTDTPFGKPIDDCLNTMLALCKKFGFSVFKDPDGYYGYAEIGSGSDMIGVLGHLDVVPTGSIEDWDSHPFKPEIRDGKLYGRGTQDDKGPTLAALFAVKAMLDCGIEMPKRIRFIFGTDEETLWRCIDKYCELEELPTLAFTPDSTFPMINAEKLLIQSYITGVGSNDLTLDCGGCLNAVPDFACYEGSRSDELALALKELDFNFTYENNIVKVLGKAAHSASSDVDGINAIARLSIALVKIGETNKAVNFIAKEIAMDANAVQIFGKVEDVSGSLTFNVAQLVINKDESKIGVDIRVPVTFEKEKIDLMMNAVCEKYSLTYKDFDVLNALYMPAESPVIQKLMAAYQEITGDVVNQPKASGGATYARAIPNCVAFGAVFPGRKEVEHMPNEYFIIEDMMLAMKIYVNAIDKLLSDD